MKGGKVPDLNEYMLRGENLNPIKHTSQNGNNNCSSSCSQPESEPDATSSIQNCYYCNNISCSCSNSYDYMEKLVKSITKEVISKLES